MRTTDGGAQSRRVAGGLRALLAVQLFSMLGDGLLTVGLTLIVVDVSKSSGALTLLLASGSAAGITTLVGSAMWLDAFNRRRTLMMVDALRIVAAAVGVVYIASGQVLLLIPVGIAAGIGVALYRPAFSAYLGDIAEPQDRVVVNSLRSTASKISSIAGPALAGLLAVGPMVIIPILAGALALVSMAAFAVSPAGMTPKRGWRGKVPSAEGFRYVWAHRWMATIMAQGAVQIGFVSAPLAIIVPMWLTGQHALGQYGYAVAVEAVGALTTSVLFLRGISVPRAAAVPMLVLQAPALLVVIAGAPAALMYPAYYVLGVAMGIFGTLWIGSLQQHVPANMLGRVLSIDELGNNAFSLIGILVTGLFLAHWSLGVVACAALVVLVLSIGLAICVPGVLTLGAHTARST